MEHIKSTQLHEKLYNHFLKNVEFQDSPVKLTSLNHFFRIDQNYSINITPIFFVFLMIIHENIHF